MKKRVLIFNDNSKRDLLGIRLLEETLKSKGFITKIANTLTARALLRSFRPHAFVAARGDHEIAREASNVCKVFIVAGEGGHQTKETMLSVFMGRGYWQLSDVSWIERCYLWSDRTKEWLQSTGLFSSDQLKVVGNPRLDLYRKIKSSEKPDKSISNQAPTVGVAFSAKSTSTYYGHPHFAEVYFKMHPEMTFPITNEGRHFEDVVWRDHAILRNMMYTIRYLLDRTDLNFWIRPSPFESPKEFEFLQKLYPGRVKIKDSQTLPDFLFGTDLLLTCWSTVGLESLLLSKPVVSISGLIDQVHLFNHISSRASGFETFVPFYHQPSNLSDLQKLVCDLLNSDEQFSPKDSTFVDELLNDLFSWGSDKGACELIAQDIKNSILNDVSPTASQWKKHIPLKYEILSKIYVPLMYLKTFYLAFISGGRKSFLDFMSNKDANVEKLINRYFSR